ncbi:MAG TPA: clostripain-related cysteine peptidase, partial [Thermoanaerobaculia bacterium]|nr:clostripain-related cysteine peptidase [Thermoanaerobaculia bacterium]
MPRQEELAPVAAAAIPDWLVMLFLCGDDTIFQFGASVLREAARDGSNDRVVIMAQREPIKTSASAKRGKVERGQPQLTENVGITLNNPQALVDFIKNAESRFPTENQLLVLWDHGNGWQNVHVFEPVARATAIVNRQQVDTLHLTDLGQTLKDRGINVVGFDSCLMAMIEIAYELRNKVEFMVAAQNVVPADSGWPHDIIFHTLTNNPEMTPQNLVSAIVNAFSAAYNDSAEPVALSAIRLSSEVDDAVAAIDVLARDLIDGLSTHRQEIMLARRYCQSFANPDYIDIISFCEQLEQRLPDTGIARAAAEVRKKTRAIIVHRGRSRARSIAGANGLSIYFPDRPIAASYAKLEFAKARNCAWSQFIERVAPKLIAPAVLTGAARASAQPSNIIPMPTETVARAT